MNAPTAGSWFGPAPSSEPGPRGAGDAIPAGTRIRPMEEADVDSVAAIESSAFTTPWKATTFRNLLDRPGAVVLVVEVPPVSVAGYAVLWCIQDQGELANIAIVAQLRDQGLGAHLLDHVLGVARDRGVESLYLEVRVSNARARSMYASRGFEEIGVRRDYYEKPREDARVLMKRLSSPR
jgi:ribosomal-protein-alanine N-acetyltransferase